MHLQLRLLDPRSGRADDVLLTAETETPIEEVERALYEIQPGRLFLDGLPLVDGQSTAGSRLRDGDVIVVDDRQGRLPVAPAVELVVVGGPSSGRRFPLSTASALIGRSSATDVTLGDPSVSRRHARLTVGEGTWWLEDVGSSNGTFLRSHQVTAPVAVQPGDLIEVGASVLEVRPPTTADADVQPDDAGGLEFNRPARIRPMRREVTVALPAKPSELEGYPFPWAQVIAPIVIAGAIAFLFRRPEAMLFALMSPVLAMSSTITYKRRNTRRSEKQEATYRQELAEANDRIATAAAREWENMRRWFPDPAALADIATGPCRRLWERREHDLDAATLRVGVADRMASIKITSRGGETPPNPPLIRRLPVAVDLAEAGVLGVAGPTSTARSVARWLLMQLATLRSPRDLQVALLTESSTADDWDWIRWLPQARLGEPQLPLALVGNDKMTREERVKELLKMLDARLEAAREDNVELFTPSVVVVFDGVRALRSMPGVPRLLKEGPAVGLYAIGIDTDANRLAEEGRAELVVDADDPAVASLYVDSEDPVPDILLDQVDSAWSDEVARALAPIRDAGGEEEAVIPSSVRYVDLAGIDLDRVDDIAGRWLMGGRTTEALVGQSLDGPFTLDLKKDGPHALVAGTTGSGKSEFLQTLVLSLAVNNRPAAMNFVLVDYKGGSAFADCEQLPHTVGMVTNLDGHLTERALASLDAELKRREQALKRLASPDVDAAWESDPDGAAAGGLARLVIVIDEFAELVQELPDFVKGLIRIARVGRSLGVHLILATQRPAGVVSPEMRSNTGLRVALRMEDKNDSAEVLEAPHAASISRSTPGRGYVRTGASATLTAFQTARVAGRRKGAVDSIPPPVADLVSWNRLGYPPPRRHQDSEATEATDLRALVSLIGEAARRLDEPAPTSPWLPPLPAVFRLPPPAASMRKDIEPVVFGVEDLPSDQAQPTATYDVVNGGHLIIAGSARSGRSTALRTLAASLSRSISPSDVHLYGLDFGNGALLAMNALPHCGGVVTRSEAARAERLIARLGDEVSRRQELLAASGFGDVNEQRASSPSAGALPYLVVLLDRWEGFTGQFSVDSGSELPAAVLRLVREGTGVGLRFVLTGDRSLLTDRVASQLDEKLVLALNDKDDYRSANINPRTLPEEMPPGRALRAESGNEVQIALLGDDPSGQAQAAALRQVGADATRRWPLERRRNRPFRVDAMPAAISFDQACELAGPERSTSPLWALVGVGGDELAAFGVDLADAGPGFVIGGPAKTGRSTALVTMARSLLRSGATIAAVCPRPSPLEQLSGEHGVLDVFTGIPDGAKVATVLGEQEGPMVVLIDDAETLAQTGVDDALRDLLRNARTGSLAVVMAGQIEDLKSQLRGTAVEVKKSKTGLLLSPPSTLDGELVGLRLPRNLTGRMPAGRGILSARGEGRVVQVPR